MDLFDIVILVGPNDVPVMETMIQHTKTNIVGYRKIFIVSCDPALRFEDCETVDEKIFPFTKETVAIILGGDHWRIGWYLQQLLKLYAGFVLSDLLNDYLVIDADTFFLKPTVFFENNLPLYNVGTEYHVPYFEHMQKLHPSLTRQSAYSGICHHMMFRKTILTELFALVESHHSQELFYKVFLQSVEPEQIMYSGASEYEIYFHYLCQFHPDDFRIRLLNWENQVDWNEKKDHDYISCHWYCRVA